MITVHMRPCPSSGALRAGARRWSHRVPSSEPRDALVGLVYSNQYVLVLDFRVLVNTIMPGLRNSTAWIAVELRWKYSTVRYGTLPYFESTAYATGRCTVSGKEIDSVVQEVEKHKGPQPWPWPPN